jgi:hypothetical protein
MPSIAFGGAMPKSVISSGTSPRTTSEVPFASTLMSNVAVRSTPAICSTPVARNVPAAGAASSFPRRKVMSLCSVTFNALCMFLSRPSFSDVSVAAGMAISNACTTPGVTRA